MSRKKTRLEIVSRRPAATVKQPGERKSAPLTRISGRAGASTPPLVSGRWLLVALGLSIAAAALCGWCALCLLFWQGSWQLLYHPSARVALTPASAGLAFDPVAFAATDAGVPRLTGWWISAAPIPSGSAAPYRRFTVLYLHGRNGNLADTLPALAQLHAAGVNVLAFDYRGYGQSQFLRPSEAHWRQDADWALAYLTATRHIDARAIVLDGQGLGANLALEIAAAHPQLAGVVVDSPILAPMSAVFSDPRARMVPARLLARDRYDLETAAAALRVPLLWIQSAAASGKPASDGEPAAYQRVISKKMMVWLNNAPNAGTQFKNAFSRWLDSLPSRCAATAPGSPAVSAPLIP